MGNDNDPFAATNEFITAARASKEPCRFCHKPMREYRPGLWVCFDCASTLLVLP